MDPGWLVCAVILTSGMITGWLLTGWWQSRARRERAAGWSYEPLTPPPRLTDPPFDGVYHGGPTPEGSPPIPALFKPHYLQRTVGNTTYTPGPEPPPNCEWIEFDTWGSTLVNALHHAALASGILHTNEVRQWHDPFTYKEAG